MYIYFWIFKAIPNIQTIAQDKFLIMCISSSDNVNKFELQLRNLTF